MMTNLEEKTTQELDVLLRTLLRQEPIYPYQDTIIRILKILEQRDAQENPQPLTEAQKAHFEDLYRRIYGTCESVTEQDK